MIKKFPIPPGVDRQGTKHTIGARWYESQNMRFRDNDPESIGGWAQNESHELEGFGRGIHTWVDFSDNQYICVGTNFKFYILVGPNRYDVTPIRGSLVTGLTNPITTNTTSGTESQVSIADTDHGANLNDFVRFDAVGADVGGIAASVFTEQVEGFQILEIEDADNYKIDVGTNASSAVSGGGTVDLHYKVASGSQTDTTGSGWGAGEFGGDSFMPTEFAFATPDPVDVTSSSPTVTFDITGFGGTAFTTDMYIYPIGLTGGAGTVTGAYLNNKWWPVASLSGANPQIDVGFDSDTTESFGGASRLFYQDENTSTVGVVGASRGWGEGSSASVVTDALRTVTIQNFGEDLLFCNRGGPIYYYDTSNNTSAGSPFEDTPALVIDSNISGATDPPTIVDSFVISEEHGHCIAVATNDIGSSTQNNMLIRWSDRHNPFVWTPTPSNEAGGRVLREGSEILGHVHTKEEIVFFTNTAIYSSRYIGSPETYGFKLISRNVTTYARGTFVAVDNIVLFMGRDQFYMYDGSVQPLSKNLSNHVFDDINESHSEKCFSGVNSKFTEVYWFYPGEGSFEPNKWVAFNYSNQTWTYGSFDMLALDESSGGTTSYARTAWQDASIFSAPMASYVTNYDPDSLPETQKSGIMNHETGRSANGSAITHSIESGQIDITEGDMYMHISRILPDVEIFDQAATATMPQVTLSIDARNLPGRSEHKSSSLTVDFSDNATSGLDYTPDYNATAIRNRGRTVSFRASSGSLGYGWRLGTLRMDIKPDGRRG